MTLFPAFPCVRAAGALLSCAVLVAQGTTLDYAPVGPEVVLDTDSTVIQPTQGPPITVVGGVFVFRNVTINAGVLVRGIGSRPMVWLVSGQFIVNGELSVRGEDGEHVNTLASANVPARGGRGGAAGGNGGDGSPLAIRRDMNGEAGFGPGRVASGGGAGGTIACAAGVGRGSGGGGGSFATLGDPAYQSPALFGTAFQQRQGIGGQGGLGAAGALSRTLSGGRAGVRPFLDVLDDNDFFGTAIDVAGRRLVAGELALPVGGQGGGGGGDLSKSSGCDPNAVNFVFDSKGGGGGGGGGCLVVYSRSFIVVGPTGRITANGGHGGGGEQAGSCNEGGGGGGGSGGMIILIAEQAIGLVVKGETYANRDYDFVLSADGGVCTTGAFGSPVVFGKYPANGLATVQGTVYDSAPLGGFGGSGIIQLVAPAGSNADGTNTHLDDGIVLVRNGQVLLGATKQRFLAWRGFTNSQGVRVDDFGVPTNIGSNEGDMRPSPILIPILR